MSKTLGSPFLYKIHGIENVAIKGTVIPAVFKESLSYKPDDSDVFVCTYPKCGTTWVQMINWLMNHDLQAPLDIEQLIMGNFLGYYMDKKTAENMEKPRFIKSHLPFDLVPYNANTKCVYVARNPFDCCSSLYHHQCNLAEFDCHSTFEEFFEQFLVGEVDCGEYFHNLMTWYIHKDDGNVHFMFYEDLKENFDEEIVKYGKFLGGKYEKCLGDAEYRAKIRKLSHFGAMKKIPSSREKVGVRTGSFCRKGINGDFKNKFSESQYERLYEKYMRYCKGTLMAEKWGKYVKLL